MSDDYFDFENQLHHFLLHFSLIVFPIFESYLKTAREILDIEQPEDAKAEENSETAYKQEDYTYKKRAKVVETYNEEMKEIR